MIEIPESISLAKQLNETVQGKTIAKVEANHSPHKFAWYNGDPEEYDSLMAGKTIGKAEGLGSLVEFAIGEDFFAVGDGTNVRFYEAGEELPVKYQTKIEFTDGSCLICTVQMYGSMSFIDPDHYENNYYWGSKEKLKPLKEGFTLDYFKSLLTEKTLKLSTKAFLATKQRIPGLGNGVLQDILFEAGLHPKRKMSTLSEIEIENMYDKVVGVIDAMVKGGGRDTENDLFGNQGGYQTKLSRKNVGYCPVCGGPIERMSYMGGNVYVCENCQPLIK